MRQLHVSNVMATPWFDRVATVITQTALEKALFIVRQINIGYSIHSIPKAECYLVTGRHLVSVVRQITLYGNQAN